jgi:hypothetical protein
MANRNQRRKNLWRYHAVKLFLGTAITAYGVAIGQIDNKIHGLKARVRTGMTRAFSPHRSDATETYGLAIGYDETRLWRVVLGFMSLASATLGRVSVTLQPSLRELMFQKLINKKMMMHNPARYQVANLLSANWNCRKRTIKRKIKRGENRNSTMASPESLLYLYRTGKISNDKVISKRQINEIMKIVSQANPIHL